MENLVFHKFNVQNNFVYYILAINAACIAFTINYTKDILLTYKEIPLSFSVVFWAISFYYGIAQIQNHEMAMQLNINQLHAHTKGKTVSEENLKKQEELSNKNAKIRNFQNLFLLAGALLFILWRIISPILIK